MDNFSEFLKAVRLSLEKGSHLRKIADEISKFDTAQKIIYLNVEHSKLQSECNYWLYMQQLFPHVDVSGILRDKQLLLNQCESILNQLGNKVISDEVQIKAVDDERKRLENEQRKHNLH